MILKNKPFKFECIIDQAYQAVFAEFQILDIQYDASFADLGKLFPMSMR